MTNKTWEEELKEKFHFNFSEKTYKIDYKGMEDVKQFITNLLQTKEQEARTRVIEEILAKLPKEMDCEEPTGTIPQSPTLAADQARNHTIRQVKFILDRLTKV